jgi:hypothetical protein
MIQDSDLPVIGIHGGGLDYYYEDASHLTEAGGQLFINLVPYMAM